MLLLVPRHASSHICFQPRALQSLHARRIIRATRTFETSAYLCAKQKAAADKQKPSPKKSYPPKILPYRPQQPKATATTTNTKTTTPPIPAATTVAARSNPVALSVAERLARRGEPTVLYQGPSHFWLRASGLSASLFCMGYVGVHYWSIMAHPPEGLAWWVPHAFVPILLAMGYLGGHFAMGAANIASSITAVPRRLLPPSYLAGGVAKKSKQEERSLALLNASPVALEVSLSQILPLLPPKKIVVAPEEVVFPFKMQATPVGKGLAAQDDGPGRGEAAAAAGGVMDKIAAPFEVLGRAMRQPFAGIVRGLTRDGFAKIKVRDKEHRIDVLGGKALDGGRILDHLVAYRSDRV
jgi:hypothetical protein